jgi:hypothetical protein
MRTLSKLLIIWGILLPLITLPSTGGSLGAPVAILNMPLRYRASLGPFDVWYDDILVGGLWLVGIGLSLRVMPWIYFYAALLKHPEDAARRRLGAGEGGAERK